MEEPNKTSHGNEEQCSAAASCAGGTHSETSILNYSETAYVPRSVQDERSAYKLNTNI